MADVDSGASRTGRVLALDFGKKRIGLAVSDELGLTAQGLDTLHRTRVRDDIEALASLVDQYSVSQVLIGIPLHMSGDESRQSAHTREFGERLQRRTGLTVEYWDERWTSVQAERMLRDSGVKVDRKDGTVDRISAVILLESYLDSLRYSDAERASEESD
jgi:putative Holliday junction resolvase